MFIYFQNELFEQIRKQLKEMATQPSPLQHIIEILKEIKEKDEK